MSAPMVIGGPSKHPLGRILMLSIFCASREKAAVRLRFPVPVLILGLPENEIALKSFEFQNQKLCKICPKLLSLVSCLKISDRHFLRTFTTTSSANKHLLTRIGRHGHAKQRLSTQTFSFLVSLPLCAYDLVVSAFWMPVLRGGGKAKWAFRPSHPQPLKKRWKNQTKHLNVNSQGSTKQCHH